MLGDASLDALERRDLPLCQRRYEARDRRTGEISGRSKQNVEKWMRGLEKGTVYQGHARFESPHTVRVNGDGDLLEGDKIFINVGGRALVPPMPGRDQVPYLTNSSMREVDYLLEHLVIIGGSYIGLEFGQMYRRFGAEVTIVEKGLRLIQREDTCPCRGDPGKRLRVAGGNSVVSH